MNSSCRYGSLYDLWNGDRPTLGCKWVLDLGDGRSYWDEQGDGDACGGTGYRFGVYRVFFLDG